MADPRKVRWSQLKVGIVGIVAFLILSVLIFLLTSSRGIFGMACPSFPDCQALPIVSYLPVLLSSDFAPQSLEAKLAVLAGICGD